MSVKRSTIGDCPFCGESIPRENILIRYDGGMYAECPDCGTPVSPE